MSKIYITPKQLGDKFENRVRKAFEKNGYLLFNQNQWNKNYAFEKDSALKREFDLVMFGINNFQFYIIECKAHYNKNILVSGKLVKEFYNKLCIHNGRHAERVMVTDTDYDRKAKEFAYANRIELMNGKKLEAFERNNNNAQYLLSKFVSVGIEHIVRSLAGNVVSR